MGLKPAMFQPGWSCGVEVPGRFQPRGFPGPQIKHGEELTGGFFVGKVFKQVKQQKFVMEALNILQPKYSNSELPTFQKLAHLVAVVRPSDFWISGHILGGKVAKAMNL